MYICDIGCLFSHLTLIICSTSDWLRQYKAGILKIHLTAIKKSQPYVNWQNFEVNREDCFSSNVTEVESIFS